jgi:type IV pilus biogenesis protein CpaD/CtpE
MMRALIPSACLLLLTALGGCVGAGTSDPPRPIPENPNRFTYHTTDFTHAVHFPATTDTLSAAEMARLQEFLKGSSARPEDKVTVSGETSPLGRSRSARVRDALARAGLVVAPGVDVNLAPNTVAVVLTEQVVDAPPRCGDWPLFAGGAPMNAPSLFLGCALRQNLYQEVADKRDLAVGVTPGPADAEPGMRAVQNYREGKGDKNKKDDSPSAANGDSGTGAASAGASMGNSGGGGGNGQ